MANCRLGQPIALTFGQTILWLLSHGLVRSNGIMDYETLYLIGPDARNYCSLRISLNLLLKKHSQERFIMADPQDALFTSEDPVRRYFETHLAWHTLTHRLKKLTTPTLEQLLAALHTYTNGTYSLYLDMFFDENETNLHKVDCLLQEYGDIYQKIKRDAAPFNALSTEEKNKLFLLIKCITLSYLITHQENASLPIKIYGAGFYADEHRGRIPRFNLFDNKSQHYGLVRPNAPLPCSDIAAMGKENEFSKPSERYTFDAKADFPRYLFSKAVHPFSTSISGTLLFLLRVLKHLDECRLFTFGTANNFLPWLQSTISLLLFHSGGHSLLEFMTVLEFNALQEAFAHLPGFADISLKTAFRDHNQEAFRMALMETKAYQTAYIRRLTLHHELYQYTYERIRANIRTCLETIEAYSGNNKKGLVEGFKLELGAHLPDKHTLANWEKAHNAIRDALRRLKHANHAYYENLRLFRAIREKNSTFTTCIANAEKALQRVNYRNTKNSR